MQKDVTNFNQTSRKSKMQWKDMTVTRAIINSVKWIQQTKVMSSSPYLLEPSKRQTSVGL